MNPIRIEDPRATRIAQERYGLQIVGPRGGDALVLAVAAALEAHLANDPRTARPVPDLQKLRAASPMAERPGFMGFG